ncbi:MAG: FkbM family methyltransferase [Gammaproteobacteria bacterium]
MQALSIEQLDVASRLGALTGETVEDVGSRLGVRAIPQRADLSRTIPKLLQAKFKRAGVRYGLPYVELHNGRVFYGLPSQRSHVQQHRLLRGLLDPDLPPECFLCALDVVHRYVADETIPVDLLPRPDGTIVEVGAYLGHKAMRMMDASIGTTGHFVAIELMPENCEIMRRNFTENGFSNTVIVREGVWNQPGEIEVMGKGQQRNTLVEIDGGRLSVPTGYLAPVSPLSDILSRTLPEGSIVDFMYLSVNGAELEAIEGLGDWAARVRSIRVAAPYRREGGSNATRARALLEHMGFGIASGPRPTIVLGTRAC